MLLHGAYQFSFLNAVRDRGFILSGFMGDPLAGKQVEGLVADYNRTGSLRKVMVAKSCLGSPERLGDVFKGDVSSLQCEQEDVLAADFAAIPGEPWQRLWYLFVWTHVATFTAYHPTLYDYFNGERSPFLDRAYANFCQGLPRSALDGRRLQIAMLERCWPAAVSVPSTAFLQPLHRTLWEEIWRRVEWRVPMARLWGARVSHSWPTDMQYRALRSAGVRALPPFDRDVKLPGTLDAVVVRQLVKSCTGGDYRAYGMLPALQAIAYALNTKD
jgi:hypothetical protein